METAATTPHTTLTGLTLIQAANAISPPEDRHAAIAGILRNAASTGHFEAKFLREEYPDNDFGFIAEDRNIRITRDETYTYVRWSGILPTT